MSDFTNLGLKKEIINILYKLDYKKPFEVQEKIIPLALSGKNIVFTSRTGSGKTIAYALGFIGKINRKLGIQMIILVPTRELCIQVGKEIKAICDPLEINVGMLYGGRHIKGDYKTTSKKNHIIVGTPGRLIQHINEKKIRVGDTRYLVYDESDTMFDLGFYDDCAYMKKRVSKDSQIILSSATITEKVERFIEEEICDYELLKIGSTIPINITQDKIYCKKTDKNNLLLKLFSEKRFRCAIIFCNTKIKTHMISQFLDSERIKAKPLNSDMLQMERLNCLNLFKDGKIKVLVATDVAARGLQIENVDIIVNYDVPTRAEFYIHRIGRSGRLDTDGYSLTFICPEDVERFDNIEFDYELNVKNIDKDFKETEREEKKEEEIKEF